MQQPPWLANKISEPDFEAGVLRPVQPDAVAVGTRTASAGRVNLESLAVPRHSRGQLYTTPRGKEDLALNVAWAKTKVRGPDLRFFYRLDQ